MIAKAIQKEPRERHLIILPQVARRFRTEHTLGMLKAAILGHVPDDAVLDLVTRDAQTANKKLLYQQPDRFSVVIACRLFDEGTDWVACSRLHNSDACESSLPLAVQRFYRPLRYHPLKKSVRIFNYLPRFTPGMAIEEQRRLVSNRVNAILAAVVTQGELLPHRMPRKLDSDQKSTNTNIAGEPDAADKQDKAKAAGAKDARTQTLGEAYGAHYPDVLRALVEAYEALPDKQDSHAVDSAIDEIIERFGVPNTVEEHDLRESLQRQMLRLSDPHYLTGDSLALRTDGIDVETIRSKGFDVVWQMRSRSPSILLFGTENLNADCMGRLTEILNTIPSLEQIHEAIRKFHARTGNRPKFHQKDLFEELGRTASAVDKLLRRHYESTLAKTVNKVLGSSNDDLLEKTRTLIRTYWSQGIRICNKSGDLPELGMTSFALNGRLTTHYGTTLAKEVEAILGSPIIPLTVERTKEVIEMYLLKGIRLSRKSGRIPELNTSSFNLAPRLERSFGVRLPDLVREVEAELLTSGKLTSPVKRRKRTPRKPK